MSDTMKYEDVLKEALLESNFNETAIKIEPTSYDDYLREDTLLEMYSKYCNYLENNKSDDKESFAVYADNLFFEQMLDNVENTVYYEDNLIENMKSYISKHYPEYSDRFEQEEKTDRFETLEKAGYEGIYAYVEDFLTIDYNLNIMFATQSEENYDMNSIKGSFLEDIDDINDYPDDFTDKMDNALTYLVYQQGHSVEEVYNSLLNDNNSESNFISSLKEELENAYDWQELVALTSVSGKEVLDFLDDMAHAVTDTLKEDKSITFSENTTIGLYDEWNGAGSVLGIELEKPATFSVDMIRNVQIEVHGRDKHNRGYTINDVYGMSSSAYTDGKATISNEPAPDINLEERLSEDIEKVMDIVKDTLENRKSDKEFD